MLRHGPKHQCLTSLQSLSDRILNLIQLSAACEDFNLCKASASRQTPNFSANEIS